ncbi:hypothetical protein PBI_EQUEMIOH13_90 [Mycobacterium phage Equemioh13]|uniref:hypothetical protein n=1 Tax=Mycobacterium phage Equemioh13 TaxID=1555201 RepID=UPI00051AA878|nr:hypothetical protein AVT12_gp16 [Mycobacterium phage Equemioh13]AIT13406.1 hypothetical protein PBI_EQUEMIOH13_90 [Mycobacterium phage Equemioh13]ATN92263.1 hypothetical protein SEA_UPDAWG_91 [Mycobacterium phage Updawg]QDM57292.1 hypothetical protein SEA_WIDEWALE_91 [Mycobacterium phage WideWale]QXN74119.1 hypothetical protein SEA_MICULUCIGAS_90 [Mycobacterium Phage MiculUcigas]
MKTEVVSTHQLREGDVILDHGMRLRIDQAINVSKAHPVEDDDRGACLWTRAVVENFAEIEASAEDGHDIARTLRSFIRSDMSPDGHRARNGMGPDTEPRWTIQGNGWARWTRVVEA